MLLLIVILSALLVNSYCKKASVVWYIREHKKALYTSLLTSSKLQSYLADVEEQAQALFDRLMKQRAERAGITETLKADNQMEWVQRMNALRSAVIETVNAEVIFV